MALKQKTADPTPILTDADDISSPVPPVEDTVLLELAMYTHYTWGGNTYEKGQAYRFKKEDAMNLLTEQDSGRQIWQIHRPAKPKVTPHNLVIDATEVTATRTRQSVEQVLKGHTLPPPAAKRIDVGTEDEIAEIVNRGDGDVTV